jgi:hypothetical protein
VRTKAPGSKEEKTVNDASEKTFADALNRMNGMWSPYGYEISYHVIFSPDRKVTWCAVYPASTPPGEWEADSSQQLHNMLFRHYSEGLRLPGEPLRLPPSAN